MVVLVDQLRSGEDRLLGSDVRWRTAGLNNIGVQSEKRQTDGDRRQRYCVDQHFTVLARCVHLWNRAQKQRWTERLPSMQVDGRPR